MNEQLPKVTTSRSNALVQTFETDIGPLAVTRAGSHNPAHPTLVLWPSLFSDHHLYDRLIPLLEVDHNLVLFDPPGHGQSGLSEKHLSLAATARASLAILDQLGLDQVRWIGSSWGGMIGIFVTLQSPKRIAHLACLNTPFDLAASPDLKTMMIVSGARWTGNTRLFADGVARTFFQPATLKSDPNFAQRHRNVFLNGNRKMLHRVALHVLMERENLSPHLPQLTVPTLIVAGREDMYPYSVMQNAAALIPDAEFQIIENSSHISAADAPVAVNAALRASWHKYLTKSEGK